MSISVRICKGKEKTKRFLENVDVIASHARPGFVGQVGLLCPLF